MGCALIKLFSLKENKIKLFQNCSSLSSLFDCWLREAVAAREGTYPLPKATQPQGNKLLASVTMWYVSARHYTRTHTGACHTCSHTHSYKQTHQAVGWCACCPRLSCLWLGVSLPSFSSVQSQLRILFSYKPVVSYIICVYCFQFILIFWILSDWAAFFYDTSWLFLTLEAYCREQCFFYNIKKKNSHIDIGTVIFFTSVSGKKKHFLAWLLGYYYYETQNLKISSLLVTSRCL